VALWPIWTDIKVSLLPEGLNPRLSGLQWVAMMSEPVQFDNREPVGSMGT